MDEAKLQEIEARANAATPGPWYAGNGHPYVTTERMGFGIVVARALEGNDCTFIAHARTDVLDLVAEVRRLTAALDVVRGDLGDTNAIADGYIARLRAEHAAALATARREGAEAMRAKCLGRLEEMLDELHENGAGRDAAAQALTDAHEYMRSSLCRIDDAPGGAT